MPATSMFTKIPPRTLNERLRLAIRWSRDHHTDIDSKELAAEFARHLTFLGLKLVWTDGTEIDPRCFLD
jgi:hypothetical protein